MANKPWHYEGTINGEYFWHYAKQSEFYDYILNEFNNYSKEDKERDFQMFNDLLESIKKIQNSEKTIKKLWFEKLQRNNYEEIRRKNESC